MPVPAYVAFALASTLLLTAPEPGMTAPPTDAISPGQSLTDAQTFATIAGKILGEAAACGKVSHERLKAAADKVQGVASSVADDEDELTSAEQLFAMGMTAGREAVESGAADCATTEASLARLERFEKR